VNIDTEGSTDISWDSITLESNIEVGFGDGVITTILGWRQIENTAISDLDSGPNRIFDIGVFLDQEQFSAETRYNGTFFDDRLTTTFGFYYFTQDLIYREFRDIVGNISTLGGNQDQFTLGAFISNEFKLTDTLAISAGGRYTFEEKSVETAFLGGGATPPCVFASTADCIFDFTGEQDYENFSPKVGVQWQVSDDAQIYGSWSRGFRSGGFTLRNTSAEPPGPTDEESQTAFELGFKGDWFNGRLRTNLALFRSEISDLQRTITTTSDIPPFTDIVQATRNTADAVIQGLEFETSLFVTDNFVLSGHLGLQDGDYENVIFDLNLDGVVDEADAALELPLLAEVTWGVSGNYTQEVPGGELDLLASYNFRSEAESNDENEAGTTQPSRNIVDASIRYTTEDERLSLAVFGKNLTNEVINQTITSLGGLGTIQPLAKGRVFGVEATVNF